MECIILLVILAVFNLLWWLVLRDLSIYTGAWMLHNSSLCGCKLVIDLASKVFVLMWKHICNHFNTNPGILFGIGAPCLRNEAWRWQRIWSLFTKAIPALECPSTWSLSDTMRNRPSIQVDTVLCPLTITVSSEAFRGAHLWQVNLH